MTTQKLVGKCSTFGGPQDSGMQIAEGVAYYPDRQPDPYALFKHATRRLGHDLDPSAYYCALRFPTSGLTRAAVRAIRVKVTNLRTGKQVVCHPADWGPNIRTGRIIDLSPGAASCLGVRTDDRVGVEYAY